MQTTREQKDSDIGVFDFEVFGTGRFGRHLSTRFSVRCDAIGLHDDEILLLSLIGPETSIKALTAGLRTTKKDQQRIDYTTHVGDLHRTLLRRCAAGYRLQRAKLDYGLWHVLCLAGLLPRIEVSYIGVTSPELPEPTSPSPAWGMTLRCTRTSERGLLFVSCTR